MNGAPSRAVVDGSQKQRVGTPKTRRRYLLLPVTAWSEILRRPSVFGSEQNQPGRMITRSTVSIIGGPRTMAAHGGHFVSVVHGPQLTPLSLMRCHHVMYPGYTSVRVRESASVPGTKTSSVLRCTVHKIPAELMRFARGVRGPQLPLILVVLPSGDHLPTATGPSDNTYPLPSLTPPHPK